jgi:AcrR family transcriptional regulator
VNKRLQGWPPIAPGAEVEEEMHREKIRYALSLYDAREMTISEISAETGVSKSLFYNELNKRNLKQATE